MQFLSHSQFEIWKDNSQLGGVSDRFMVCQKVQYSYRYDFLKFIVLLIDLVLGIIYIKINIL